MPRPPIMLGPSQVAEVETLAALLNQDQIADYFGMARNTFRAICARDEEVLARYKRGKAKAIAHVANGLLQKARAGDTTSMIFYLKTQAGWREVDRTGETGAGVTRITREIVSPKDALRKLLDEVAAKGRRIGADRSPADADPEAIPLGCQGEGST
jgi:hypothetical protein